MFKTMAAGGGGGGDTPTVGKSMGMLKQAAADGTFAVNESGGQALLQAIREMAKWVDDNLGQLGTLGQQPALGSSNGAAVMKPYMAEVATDDQGFVTMLREFRASLVDAEAGVIGAMNNYNTIEYGLEGKFRG